MTHYFLNGRMEKEKTRVKTQILKKTRFKCRMCFRILDDCLFVDEQTKLLTPFCKFCRVSLRDQGSCARLVLPIAALSEPVTPTLNSTTRSKEEGGADSLESVARPILRYTLPIRIRHSTPSPITQSLTQTRGSHSILSFLRAIGLYQSSRTAVACAESSFTTGAFQFIVR